MTDLRCDVAIIGAGTAGLAAERSARSAGASTLLIDDRFAGTTCATVGCMPAKLLIAAAEAAAAVRRAAIFGIRAREPEIVGAAVLQRVREERDRFVSAAKASFEDLPAGVMVRASARFTSPTKLALDDGRTVSARAIVVATGSKPNIPETFAPVEAMVLTNETLFELTEFPRSVAVIGAGPLGLELGQALARLGVETMVFDQSRILAGIKDRAVATELRRIVERDVPLRLGVALQARASGGGVSLSWTGDTTGERHFDRVLIAAGRPPQLSALGLEETGLRLDEHGTPVFDRDTLQCGGTPIFLAGDATGERAILHEASWEGELAGRNAARAPKIEPGRRAVPVVLTFTDPPVALLGDAHDGMDAVVGSAPYEDQGRAKIMARNSGLVRLYAERTTGRLIGAVMAAPGADHMGHLIAWAIESQQTAAQILDRPFYHPTLEEGLKPALRDICRQIGDNAAAEGK